VWLVLNVALPGVDGRRYGVQWPDSGNGRRCMCFTDGNGCGSAGASAVADAVLYPAQSDRRVPPRSSNRGMARSDSAFARRAPPTAIFLIFNYLQNQFSTQEKQLGAEEKFVEVGNTIWNTFCY
jgi:hypothetical protein